MYAYILCLDDHGNVSLLICLLSRFCDGRFPGWVVYCFCELANLDWTSGWLQQ